MSGSAFSRVTIAVDLRRRQDHLIDRASRLPLQAGARLTLVHALPRGAARVAEAESVADLRALGAIALARRPDLAIEHVIRRRDPATQLAVTADATGAELIVVGREEPPCGWMRSATTAERVSRRTDVPILAVRRGACAPYRTLVAAIESTGEASERGIEVARRLVGTATYEGDVIHALDDAIERRMQNAGAPRRAVLMARRWLRARSRAEITAWLHRRSDPRRLRVWLERGDPSGTLLALSGRERPDLVVLVIGGGWLRGRLFRVSMVGAVLRRAECDVLLVRARRASAAADASASAAA